MIEFTQDLLPNLGEAVIVWNDENKFTATFVGYHAGQFLVRASKNEVQPFAHCARPEKSDLELYDPWEQEKDNSLVLLANMQLAAMPWKLTRILHIYPYLFQPWVDDDSECFDLCAKLPFPALEK